MNTKFRMMELSYEGFSCSQILLILALEAQEKQNPDLVRSASGLAFGGGAETGTCGALTGAACVLALYGGKGAVGETEREELQHMLRELREWFELVVGGKYGGTTCGRIVGDGADRKRRCGAIVEAVHIKTGEILTNHGFEVTTD